MYADSCRTLYPPTIRSTARHLALSMFAQAKRGTHAAAARRPRVQMLYLHHVFADEEQPFRKLLRYLSQHYQLISYSEAVSRIWTGKLEQPAIAFSFDDGLKNNLRAANILEEFGTTACFFLPCAIIGETDYPTIQRFCAERLHNPPLEFMNWQDVETLLRAGHEIGGHTMNHVNLSEISTTQLHHEIGASLQLLTERVGPVQHFAWPYGHFHHFSPAARRAVFTAGYQTCASAMRGCHVAQADAHDLCLRREHTIACWPLSHMRYFIGESSMQASAANNHWPTSWNQEAPIHAAGFNNR